MKSLFLLLFVLLLINPVQADVAEEFGKPFAEQFVALQISDRDEYKRDMVLNVANNLLKHYGTDAIAIEIVAFGPSVPMMLAGSAQKERIAALAQQGVRFSACNNTLNAIEKKTGKRPEVLPEVNVVPAGIARFLELQDMGFKPAKP